MDKIEIFTDGACRGNPGDGGWGALIVVNSNESFIYGGERNTTNNKMELMAAIKALDHFDQPSTITLTTDSEYVRKGITEWIENWKVRGWKTASKKPVKNKELWEELDLQISKHNISWEWVKGHTGEIFNEKADFLARRFIEKI